MPQEFEEIREDLEKEGIRPDRFLGDQDEIIIKPPISKEED